MTKTLQLINSLHPADVIVAKKNTGIGRILNHYIVYDGNGSFIGNLKKGVQFLSLFELNDLLKDYEPIRVKPFIGNDIQRKEAINRAYSRIGQKYNLINFNCEHFSNFVQKGSESSKQVLIAFFIAFIFIFKLIKIVTNGKR